MPDESTSDIYKDGLSPNKTLVLVLAFMLAPMVLLIFIWKPDSQASQKLETLRQIAAEIPVYPDFMELDSSSMLKSGSSRLTINYDVPAYSASFETVKRYYTEALTARCWSSVEENIHEPNGVGFEFRKGKYSISIFYSEGGTKGWDYSVSYGWRDP